MRTVIERLLDCSPSPASAALAAEFYDVEARIEKHLDSYFRAKIAELETQRDALSKKGRDIEERKAALRGEVGQKNSWANSLAEQMNRANQRLAQIVEGHPARRSHFPTTMELDAWKSEKTAAEVSRDEIRAQLSSVQGFQRRALHDYEGARRELDDIINQCASIAEEIRKLRAN